MLADSERDEWSDSRASQGPSTSSMNVRVLGAIEVVHPNGTTVQLAGRPGRILVEMVAHPSGCERTALADALWPNGAPATGASALRVHLSTLRRALAPAGVQLVRGPAGDRLDGLRSDLDVFDALVADARSLRSPESEIAQLRAAATRVADALALWRGRPFGPFGDDPTLIASVESAERRRSEAEELLVDLHLECGDPAGALRVLDQSGTDRTFDEGWWARRLLALYRSGRQRDALAEYERARLLLAEELGLNPGPLLRDMHQRVLHQDPALDRTAPTRRSPTTAHSIVGRTVERERLADAQRRVTQDGLAISVVRGEPGIGKTALVNAFIAELPTSVTSAVGRAERTASIPLRGVLSAMEPWIGDAGGPEGVGTELALRSSADHEARHDSMALNRHEVLSRIADLVVSLSEDGPTTLVIDDAHWVDPMTVAFLDHLITEHPKAPVHVVLTARETPFEGSMLDGLLSDASLTTAVSHLRLGPLTADEIGRIAPGEGDVHRASGGNPLFALQLRRLWGESGRDAPLPDGLLALCEQRVRRLPASTREVLDGAAVLGLEFDVDDVAAAVGTPSTQVTALLEAIDHDELVERDRGAARFRFVHGIVRRAVYESMDPGRRVALHLAAARHLEHDPGRLPERAAHLADARPLVPDDEVASAAGAAATQLLGIGAGEQAARFFQLALSSLSPSDHRRADAYLGLGLGLRLESDETAAAEALLQAWTDAADNDRWEVAADALIAQTDFGPAATIPAAMEVVERIDRTLDGLGQDRSERREILLTHKAHLLVNIDPEAAERAMDRATELVQGEPGLHLDHARVRLRESRGDDPASCAEDAAALSARAERDGNARLAAEMAVHEQAAWLRAGDLDTFDRGAGRRRALAQRTGLAMSTSISELIDVARLLAAGPIGAADEASERATANPPDGLGDLLVTSRFMHLLTIRREQLRLGELEPVLVASLELNPRRLPRPLVAMARLEAGDLDGATAQLDTFVDELDQVTQDWVYVATLSFAADAAVDCGHEVLARALRGRFDQVAPQVVVGCTGLIVGSHIDRHRGALAAVSGDLDEGIATLASVVARERERGASLWFGWAALDEARARLRRATSADLAVAEARLDDAATVSESAGSKRLAEAVHQLRTAAG